MTASSKSAERWPIWKAKTRSSQAMSARRYSIERWTGASGRNPLQRCARESNKDGRVSGHPLTDRKALNLNTSRMRFAGGVNDCEYINSIRLYIIDYSV